jgi:hypothetical protein
MASKIGKALEQTLVRDDRRLAYVIGLIGVNGTMYLRYAVVGCCIVVAAILIFVSSSSYQGSGECRNWSARPVMSLFTPCAAKAQVNEPFNIGAAPNARPDDRNGP